MPSSAKVRCERCETWIPVQEKTDHVKCDCGARFAITITKLSAQPV